MDPGQGEALAAEIAGRASAGVMFPVGFDVLKTVVAIRHIEFEDLGFFEAPLIDAGYKIHYYDAGQDDLWTLDPLRTPLIVVLGGPMGVYDTGTHPFLEEELQLVRDRIAAEKPILGIWLGAQLIARALGATVYPGPAKEIGLFPIALTDAGRISPLSGVSPEQPVLHWHGDTFDLPSGATLLASTDAYANQAFAYGRNVLALQFHLEAGAGFDRWINGHSRELDAVGIDPGNLKRLVGAAAPALQRTAAQVLARWLASLEG